MIFGFFTFCNHFKEESIKQLIMKLKKYNLKYHTNQTVSLRKFPLAPMGVLAPGSAHTRPSAQPPIHTSGNFQAHMSADHLQKSPPAVRCFLKIGIQPIRWWFYWAYPTNLFPLKNIPTPIFIKKSKQRKDLRLI